MEETIADSRFPALVYGDAGGGKTCAIAWFYCHWPTDRAEWHGLASLLARIMRCRQNGGCIIENGFDVYESQIFRWFAEASLVCIDDVGLKSLTDPQHEAFLQLLDSRIGKPLICTSNLTPAELAQVYDDRVASRLCAGALIELRGVDRRTAGKKVTVCS